MNAKGSDSWQKSGDLADLSLFLRFGVRSERFGVSAKSDHFPDTRKKSEPGAIATGFLLAPKIIAGLTLTNGKRTQSLSLPVLT